MIQVQKQTEWFETGRFRVSSFEKRPQVYVYLFAYNSCIWLDFISGAFPTICQHGRLSSSFVANKKMKQKCFFVCLFGRSRRPHPFPILLVRNLPENFYLYRFVAIRETKAPTPSSPLEWPFGNRHYRFWMAKYRSQDKILHWHLKHERNRFTQRCSNAVSSTVVKCIEKLMVGISNIV